MQYIGQEAGDFDQAHKFLKRSLQMKESLFDKKHPSAGVFLALGCFLSKSDSFICTSSVLEQVRITVQSPSCNSHLLQHGTDARSNLRSKMLSLEVPANTVRLLWYFFPLGSFGPHSSFKVNDWPL